MNLAPLPDWLVERLRCPCPHHAPLSWDPGPRCSDPSCPRAAGFPVTSGQPVLIDFDASILDRGHFERTRGISPVRRAGRGLRYWVRRIAYGINRVAPANADEIVRHLREVPAPVVLIIGGGESGVGVDRLRTEPKLRLAVFDVYPSQETQFVSDAHGLPLQDGAVDAVWIQAVLEHVLDPATVAAEIRRVLRPGGLVYAETPFLQQVHEAAFDFTRFTENGHRWLFRDFERLDSGTIGGPGTVLIWSIRAAMTGLTRSRKLGEAFTLPFFWLRWIDRLIPEPFASDGASGTYFLGRKVERPLEPTEMVESYRGAQRR